MRTKEVFEDKKFIPLQHIRFMRDVLELPAPSGAPAHPPAATPPLTSTSPAAQALMPLEPCLSCRDTNYFRIWHTLLHTPTPPYAPMPPTPPASPSPLLLPADMPDLDLALLLTHAPPHHVPRAPPPIEVTDNTYSDQKN